jgi:hypothetical protein
MIDSSTCGRQSIREPTIHQLAYPESLTVLGSAVPFTATHWLLIGSQDQLVEKVHFCCQIGTLGNLM